MRSDPGFVLRAPDQLAPKSRGVAAAGRQLWYSCAAMRVLFVISVTALVALLWATFSIARFVRCARRKQRAVRRTYSPHLPLRANPPPRDDLPETRAANVSLSRAGRGQF